MLHIKCDIKKLKIRTLGCDQILTTFIPRSVIWTELWQLEFHPLSKYKWYFYNNKISHLLSALIFKLWCYLSKSIYHAALTQFFTVKYRLEILLIIKLVKQNQGGLININYFKGGKCPLLGLVQSIFQYKCNLKKEVNRK